MPSECVDLTTTVGSPTLCPGGEMVLLGCREVAAVESHRDLGEVPERNGISGTTDDNA